MKQSTADKSLGSYSAHHSTRLHHLDKVAKQFTTPASVAVNSLTTLFELLQVEPFDVKHASAIPHNESFDSRLRGSRTSQAAARGWHLTALYMPKLEDFIDEEVNKEILLNARDNVDITSPEVSMSTVSHNNSLNDGDTSHGKVRINTIKQL